MKFCFVKSLAVTALLTGSAALAPAQDSDGVRSDQMLPAETYLHISIGNVEALKNAFNESSGGQFMNDPVLDDFKQEVMEAFGSDLDEVMAGIEENLGVSVDELLSIPTGEVSISLSAAGRSSLGMSMILDYGDHADQMDELLSRASEALSQVDELERDDDEYDGTEIVIYNLSADEKPPTPIEASLAWFRKDTKLVISNSPTLLKKLLDNWGGSRTETLLTNEKYAYVLERCQTGERTALMTSYLDIMGLIDRVVTTGAAGPASFQVSMAAGFLPQLGVQQLKAIGGCVEMNVGDFESISRSVVYLEDEPPQGVMRIFQGAPTPSTPPSWVKSNASSWMALNWKIDEAYSAVEELVDGFTGPGNMARIIDDLANEGPGIHIKNDVIDVLNGQLQVVTSASPEGKFGGDRFLLALGVRDEQAAKDLLTRITDDSSFPGDTREFRGATLYQIENPSSDQSIAFTVSNGYLYFCVGAPLLEQVLRDDSDLQPLSETEEFQKLAAHFPSDTTMVSFSRPSDQIRTVYEGLRTGTILDALAGSADIFERIDFGTLPPFEKIEKYFTPTGGYSISEKNGTFSQSFSLKK